MTENPYPKLVIVAAHFPQESNIASLRPYYFASHLSELGFDVKVITVIRESQLDDLNFDISKFHIQRISNKYFDLFRKLILGYKKAEKATSELKSNSSPSSRLKLFLIGVARKYGIFCSQRWPDFFDLWAKTAYKEISNQKFDIILTTAPPYAIHKVGYWYKKKYPDTIWIADWRDLWIHHPIYPGLPIARHYEKYLELRYFKNADINTFATDGMVKKAQSYYRQLKAEVLYNGFDFSYKKHNTPKSRDDIFQFVYTGTVYPGYRDADKLLSAFSEALERSSNKKVNVQFVFAGSCESVLDTARNLNILEHVSVLGRLKRDDAISLQYEADGLIYLDCVSPDGSTEVIGGKLFEYLCMRKPVISVNSPPNGEAATLLEKSGLGKVFYTEQQENLVNFFSSILTGNSEISMPPNDNFINQFSRRASSLKLANYINREIDKKPITQR